MVMRALALVWWRTLAVVSLVLGFVGAFVPLLPTVPFLLLAAWAGSKGWPALEAWLLAHPRHGAAIRRWRDHRAVPRRAKWLASATMLLSMALIVISGAHWGLKLGMVASLATVAFWLWRRPEV